MKSLFIKIQNIKGNEAKHLKNLGYVATFLRHPNDLIVIDDFQGQGDNYKKRELSEIRIYDNDNLIFKGDKYKLFKQLKNQNYETYINNRECNDRWVK